MEKKPPSSRNRISDILLIMGCFFILLLTFLWYNSYFQKPHFKPTSPAWLEITFYELSTFLLLLPLLKIIYKIVTWSPRVLKAARYSTTVNTLSNLSFAIYMVHGAVIETKLLNFTKQYSFYFFEIVGHLMGDLVYVILFSFMAALLIELPCSSLWRAYSDSWFFQSRPKIIQKMEDVSENSSKRTFLPNSYFVLN